MSAGEQGFRDSWARAVKSVSGCIMREDAPRNEHQTRRSVIDPMLEALGWPLASRQPHNEETSIKTDDGAVFLDYLCIDEGSMLPKLLVEAKRWDHQAPTKNPKRPDLKRHTPVDLIRQGIIHLAGQITDMHEPLTQVWMDWLRQVYGYTIAINKESGVIPKRVVVTNGRWIMIITEPESVFISNNQIPDGAVLFFEEQHMYSKSEEIYKLLSKNSLCLKWKPLIAPSKLPIYLKGRKIVSCCRGVAISHNKDSSPYTVKPRLRFFPLLLFGCDDGAQLCILSDNVFADLMPVAGGGEPDVENHLESLKSEHAKLLKKVVNEKAKLPEPHALSKFAGFISDTNNHMLDLAYGSKSYAKYVESETNERFYVVALGTENHFITKTALYHDCSFHSADACQAISRMFKKSVLERGHKTMFRSSDKHYCSHKNIREPREEFCVIRDVELGLCCQQCIFLNTCWATRIKQLPCESCA